MVRPDGDAAPVAARTDRARTDRARATRRRVLDTARTCIAELGPLGATSNEIARRSGVSWGVIQYHFGTREGILLALIEDGFETLLEALDGYEPGAGATADERIGLVADAIWSYCSQPEYMLYMDVLRLLSHDPTSADAVDAMLQRAETQLTRRMNRFLRGAVASESALAATRGLVFATMRGLALRQSFTRARPKRPQSTSAERALLVRALRLALAEDS
jgi:TetR/AcrR family transcriptional regulator, regulator of cefoperazone and chloramphenicol sensitivity